MWTGDGGNIMWMGDGGEEVHKKNRQESELVVERGLRVVEICLS